MNNELVLEQKEEEGNYKFIKWVSTIIALFLLVGYGFYQANKGEAETLTIVLVSIGILVVWAIIFFWSKFYDKFLNAQKKLDDLKKIPDPLSEQQLMALIEPLFDNDRYKLHIRQWGHTSSAVFGPNIIYKFEIYFHTKDRYLGEGIVYLVNAHYPERRSMVKLSSKDNVAFMKKSMNELSTNPIKDPVIKETVTENVLTGNVMKTKEIGQRKEEEQVKQKEKTGDLG